jgi:hypothetical protein
VMVNRRENKLGREKEEKEGREGRKEREAV